MGETADLVRRVVGRINARDVEGAVELFSPRVRFQDVPEIPGARLYEGREGIRQWAEMVLDMAEDFRFTLWEMEERDDALMVETGVEMTGSASGAPLGWRFWAVWRVREGMIAYHHGYSEREPAVADFEGGG